MDLKNAVAVCLISLFSATLVLLIARALDLQTASRLEPQLERIAEQLEAIRAQGGIVVGDSNAASPETLQDGLMIYYFHGNTRCPTCEAIESQSHEVVKTDFSAELETGEVTWKTTNYEQPAGEELSEKFEVLSPVVVLAKMKDGQIDAWRRLDRVWGLVDEPPAFADFVRTEIRQMLDSAGAQDDPTPPDNPPLDIPIPSDPPDIPVPE
jgi:hypothetical protein